MIRTFKHKHGINKEKQKAVLAVLCEYRKTCDKISKQQWRLFYEGDGFDKTSEVKNIPSKLSERYKRNCCYQVVGQLKSFVANRQNDFTKIVWASFPENETRKHLLQINRRKLWFKNSHEKFTSEELFLARKIFKHILSKHNKPSFSRVNMLLNSNVAQIILADKNESPEFDYWIKFATLNSGKPIELPIKSNSYFESLTGKMQQSVQVNQSRSGEIEILFMKDVQAKVIQFKTEKLAIDIGLKNLFTLDNGDVFSRNFYENLKYYDALITNLVKNRQRRKLKTRSRRYDNLINKAKGWIKNEVCRTLNQIVKLYAPSKIIIERLNFQNQNLSKRLNRLLGNFGKQEIIKKLKSLKEEFGIQYEEINPAYTSQQCPNEDCGYVDAKNRPTQEKFKCRCCGYKRNADVVGARNIFARSSDKFLSNIYLKKDLLLQKLVIRFLERNSRHRSLANGSLSDNSYFKNRLTHPKLVA